MDPAVLTLLILSFILFFGFFSEFIFRKTKIPDVLFLAILGFVIGPNVLKLVFPADLADLAPVFTSFALLFLLFDGAFNISLSSFLKEFSDSAILTFFNFLVSSVVVASLMMLSGFSLISALLCGFILGGTSSAFVIPILKQLKVKQKIYSLLSFESALTDVLCIVSAFSVMEIIRFGSFGVQKTLTQLFGLFAIAGFVGIIAGVLWILLVIHVFKEHNYTITVAYLLLLFVVTEYIGGNGAIATLFFGIILKNSKRITFVVGNLLRKSVKADRKGDNNHGLAVTTHSEEFFYHQISFVLKTFFFVYIGILIDISDWRSLLIGGSISGALLFSRTASRLLTKHFDEGDRALVDSIFARGLAAAAIALTAVKLGIPEADLIAEIVFVVIAGTIILSSLKIFISERRFFS
jgi:NhaP-type Na+/H+ or K+/H+ antiporter